jgi:hypothetical protein
LWDDWNSCKRLLRSTVSLISVIVVGADHGGGGPVAVAGCVGQWKGTARELGTGT